MKLSTPREPAGRIGQRRQVVIPRDFCDALRIREGDFVAFVPREGGVLIKPKRLVDADDIRDDREAALLAKAERQMRAGGFVGLADLDHELAGKPRKRSPKTA